MQRKEKRCFRQQQHARTQAQMQSGVVSGDTGWSSDPAYQCWLNVHEQPLQLGGQRCHERRDYGFTPSTSEKSPFWG